MDRQLSTRDRVLQAASEIFSDKGFRDTTVAEICERASANIASVNYHFGDKESLYDEVWRHAFAITAYAYPLEGDLSKEATVEECLLTYTRAFLHRIFSEEQTGLFAKLLYREMASPTIALDKIANEVLFPQTQHLVAILEKIPGKQLDDQTLLLCKHSIIGQCAFYNFSRPLREHVMGKKTIPEEEIEQIARHIARFSLAGLKELKNEA
jgi:AcrR family transcriptional regulator